MTLEPGETCLRQLIVVCAGTALAIRDEVGVNELYVFCYETVPSLRRFDEAHSRLQSDGLNDDLARVNRELGDAEPIDLME